MNDKEQGERYGWHLIDTDYPYVHRMFRVRVDTVHWPDGQVRPFTYIETKPVVLIVPLTPAGEVVLIRQFRYVIDDWAWELPAGGSHDFDGDDLLDLARRELAEEIGGEAEAWRKLGVSYLGLGLMPQAIHIYLATGVKLQRQHTEIGEIIEVHPLPFEEALAMAYRGEITSGLACCALFRAAPLIRATLTTPDEHGGSHPTIG